MGVGADVPVLQVTDRASFMTWGADLEVEIYVYGQGFIATGPADSV